MHGFIIKNVSINPVFAPVAGSHRLGTAYISREEFARRFGMPHMQDSDPDASVTVAWSVKTPRGVVEIGDYWWNNKSILSIRATNKNRALWVISWLKCHGVKANLTF